MVIIPVVLRGYQAAVGPSLPKSVASPGCASSLGTAPPLLRARRKMRDSPPAADGFLEI